MARTNNLKDFLTDVANEIRTKKGTTVLLSDLYECRDTQNYP